MTNEAEFEKRVAAVAAVRHDLFDQHGEVIISVDVSSGQADDPSVVLPKGRDAVQLVTTYADGHSEDVTGATIGLPAAGNDGTITLQLWRPHDFMRPPSSQ